MTKYKLDALMEQITDQYELAYAEDMAQAQHELEVLRETRCAYLDGVETMYRAVLHNLATAAEKQDGGGANVPTAVPWEAN